MFEPNRFRSLQTFPFKKKVSELMIKISSSGAAIDVGNVMVYELTPDLGTKRYCILMSARLERIDGSVSSICVNKFDRRNDWSKEPRLASKNDFIVFLTVDSILVLLCEVRFWFH